MGRPVVRAQAFQSEQARLHAQVPGGTDASNTDPWATQPPAGSPWVHTGAHVMPVGIGPETLTGYPSSPTADTSRTYVMWADTPYAHRMLPVR